jgi:hypothetical protein
MSFRQFCNAAELSTFSTESVKSGHCKELTPRLLYPQ